MYFMPGLRTTAPSGSFSRMALDTSTSSPRARSKSSSVMWPGRNRVGLSPTTDTTVLSTPTSHSPPSKINGRRPSISVNTSCALVGLGLPERLALGAAKAQPLCWITARATGWLGIRMPTVSSPAQHSSATSGPRGMMMVSGPGQKAAISSWARSGTSLTRPGSISGPVTWTMRGLSCGRPLATKISRTAAPLRASAAMP